MVLSQRERIAALLALIVVGALVADKLVVSPVLQRLQEAENRKQQLLAQLNEAQSLFDRRRLMERKWKTMLSDGLQDEAEAESRLVRALDKWSQATRLALTSVKPERVVSDKGMNEMTFVVAGQGSMNAVARFLWQVETAELPVKVKDMQLGLASSETGDSMSLELRLSALYLGAERKPVEKAPAQPQPQEANDEEQLL
jgi:Tfp pilus assembly protein PilO